MLKSLAISNYALIDNLEISFPDGLVIITGETGAGKSILLGAISLLLGAKADKDILKDNSKNCVVEALFTITPDHETEALFAENSLELSDEILIRRVVSPNGRTRSFLNDDPVSFKFLKELSEKIIDIHAQHEHLLIGNSNFQLSVLDSYAGNTKLLIEYRELLDSLRFKEKELAAIREKAANDDAEAEYNQFRFNQLNEANLTPGQLEEIESEYKILSNAGEIKGSLYEIIQMLNPHELSIVQTLKEVFSHLDKAGDSLPQAKQISERVESCRIELKEAELEIVKLAESISINPERALQLENRISLIFDLLQKFRVKTVEELIAVKEDLAGKLGTTIENKEKIAALQKEIEELMRLMQGKASDLTASRKEASKGFAQEIEGRIKELEMPFARFSVQINTANEYGINGKESIDFLFSANKDMPMRELSRIASGGELSRIMLCLKALMAKGKEMPTLIFDEIDSGVSGSIADRMGILIGELSENMQLFTITHLPQIASKGNFHLLVYKDEDSGGTISSKIKQIDGQERVMEIARMLSGTELTQAAVANAKDFLKQY